MQRHWTADVSNPFDLVDWTTTHINLVNWKTGDVVYRKDVEHPVDWAPSAVEMCASKYFRRADIPKIGGEHSVKQLATRVANDLAQHGKKRGYFNEDEANIFRDEIIAGFITQRIGFNSPVWFNFGLFNEYGIEGTKGRDRFVVNPETNQIEKIDGELIRPGGAACFLTRVTDSLFSDENDGMFDWIATQTKVFLTGAGDGANVSNIRGVGEPIAGGGISAGLPAFLPVRDQGSGYIKSGGKTRRSATMLVCDLDHPDIEWYINWKRHEEAKAQALIAMGYDADYEGEAYGTVSGQNSNNSVRIPNSFMDVLNEDGYWYLLSRCDYDRFPGASANLTEGEKHPQGRILYADKEAVAIRGKNGVKKIMKAVRARDLWNQIAESAWSCGCPGIHFEDTINAWNTMPHYGEIRTSNPCFSGDTLIPTSTGLVRIADWASEGDVRRLWSNGMWIEATAFPTKVSETITLRLSNGFEITCTPDHRFELTDGGEVLAKDAIDHKIKIVVPDVDAINDWDSHLVFHGFMQGDGLFHEASGYFKYIYIGENDADVKNFIESLGINLTSVKYRPYTYSVPTIVGKSICNKIKPVTLPFRDLTDDILYLPPHSMASFLRGLYSANGSVVAERKRVMLKTPCRNFALQVQQALLSLGIRSYVTTNKPTTVRFENGIYECRESYDLNIASSDCVEFAKKIGFIQTYKNEELLKIVDDAIFDRRLHARVVDIVEGDVEQVYDFTLMANLEDKDRWACVSGVSAHNCSEIFQPDNTTCNLCSVNLIKFFANLLQPDWDGFEHASKLVITALDLVVDISSYPTSQHARGAWDIRSIGANHGNIGAVLMRNAIPYDSCEGRCVMSIITNVMTLFCWQQSHELGKKLGNYPAYHEENHRKIIKMHRDAIVGINAGWNQQIISGFNLEKTVTAWDHLATLSSFRNSNVTCLVPQGTIGLVLGQDTTGCEPDFALKKSKKCVGGTYMDFVNNSVEPALERLGYDAERIRLVVAYVMKYGAVENCPYIDDNHLSIFDTAVRQKTCLDAIAYIVRNLEEEEAELVFKVAGNENDPFKIKNALLNAREDEDDWQELLEDLDNVSEINQLIKNCTSVDQVRQTLADYEYDLYAIMQCVQIFTRVISSNGHIDALGAFQPHISMGISKCVTGDTLIHTDKGFIEIGSFHDSSQKEDSFVPLQIGVMTKDGCAKTDSFYYGGKKRILRMELSNGQVIATTPNHPLFASVEGGEKDPEWNNAENLHSGDYVAIDIGRDIWASDFVNTTLFFPTPRYDCQKTFATPDVVDEKIAWLLGFFASQGHHVRCNWTIGFTNNNESVLEKLAIILQERFGIKAKIERDYRNDVGYVKVASKTLYEFFSWCGALETSTDKQVPWVILQSPREVVIQFISGLWLDGFVPKAVASACITLKSKKMIEHLQILLHNFGIRCVRQVKHSDQHGPSFRLMTASRESFEKFTEIISLDDDWKVAQIRQHLAYTKSEAALYSSDFVPNSIRREAAVAYGSIHKLDSRTKDFGTLISETTTRCSWQVADEAFKASGRDGLGTMHWVQVTSIIEDEEEVYDISVPEHRSFIGNGVVCHNTVNMNHDASIGDVAKAYERAFDKGCKCVAIYRDDSKKSQPLNTGTNKGKTKGKKATERSLEKVSFDESIETYLNTPEGLQEALRRVVKNPELAAMVPPTRREPSFHTSVGDRFHFTLPYQGETISVFIRFNCWQNTNDIMEVFIDLGKEGDTISGLIDSMARIISLGLQFGIPPKTIGHMLEGMNFGPNGFLGRSSVFGIRSVKSVPDLVGKLLQILPEYYAMGRPAAMLQPKPFSLDDPAPKYEPVSMAGNIATRNGKQEKAANLVEFPKSEKASVPTPTFVVKTQVRLKDEREITTSQEARARGFTGSTCKKCGSLRTVGTRSCFQCLDCGEYNGPCGG